MGDLAPNTVHCDRCALPLPPPSQVCSPEAATPAGRLCPACQQSPPAFTQTVAPWLYDPPLAYLVSRWKHHGQRQLTRLFGELWLQQVERIAPVDLVVPVPLHWRRRWRRGFNQSEALAGAMLAGLSARGCSDARIATNLVTRRRHTASQQGLTASQRRRNLADAFTVRKRCDNLRVAVVDDVMTTGATAAAMAEALLHGGARRVDLWCLARTPAPEQ